MTEPTSARELFKGRHFDHEIVVLWYLTFRLSSRDLVQTMAERGIALAHTTILRWVLLGRNVNRLWREWSNCANACRMPAPCVSKSVSLCRTCSGSG